MWEIALPRSLWCTTRPFFPSACARNEHRPWLRTVRKDKHENGEQTSRTGIFKHHIFRDVRKDRHRTSLHGTNTATRQARRSEKNTPDRHWHVGGVCLPLTTFLASASAFTWTVYTQVPKLYCCSSHPDIWKPDDLMIENATSLRKSAPGSLNISDEHISCTGPATENASLQILFTCPTPAIVCGHATKSDGFAHFWHGAQAMRNDIWTSKSGPNMWCLEHFDLEMCFAPQPCALFRHLNFKKCSEPGMFCTFCLGNVLRATKQCALFQHLNFQKWSENGVLCTCWLANVLRATTACTFSTSQLPKVVRAWCALYILISAYASRHSVHFFEISTSKRVRAWCALYILTSACASRHNCVQFLISHLLAAGHMAPHPPL